jgi:hypothetical protein
LPAGGCFAPRHGQAVTLRKAQSRGRFTLHLHFQMAEIFKLGVVEVSVSRFFMAYRWKQKPKKSLACP